MAQTRQTKLTKNVGDLMTGRLGKTQPKQR